MCEYYKITQRVANGKNKCRGSEKNNKKIRLL
jgi:hypothetical protein